MWQLKMSLKPHWEILLINVWSVLWRISPFSYWFCKYFQKVIQYGPFGSIKNSIFFIVIAFLNSHFKRISKRAAFPVIDVNLTISWGKFESASASWSRHIILYSVWGFWAFLVNITISNVWQGQAFSYTVWKFDNFSFTLILREISHREYRSSKTINFVISETLHYWFS